MSWKRSSGGTSIVSTSARWIASPTLRRYSGVLPLTRETRTRGMAASAVRPAQHPCLPVRRAAFHQCPQRRDDDPSECLGAPRARPGQARPAVAFAFLILLLGVV